MPEKCGKCIGAGVFIEREHDSYRADSATPILYEENLRGLVSAEGMTVPHSELAMHVGAAGKKILACFKTPGSAFVVYEDLVDGCGFTFGLDSEVMSPELRRKIETSYPYLVTPVAAVCAESIEPAKDLE